MARIAARHGLTVKAVVQSTSPPMYEPRFVQMGIELLLIRDGMICGNACVYMGRSGLNVSYARSRAPEDHYAGCQWWYVPRGCVCPWQRADVTLRRMSAAFAAHTGREESNVSDTERFRGAVHDETSADIGHNPAGQRVVRLEVVDTRGPNPTSTVLILTDGAAIALRNQLDGLFANARADLDELLRFARAFASLGDAVDDQVSDLLGGFYRKLNSEAVDLIGDRLGGMNRELDEALAQYREWRAARKETVT
jgi:hypothetical protein